jgi:hypothetical protein
MRRDGIVFFTPWIMTTTIFACCLAFRTSERKRASAQ